MGRALRVWDPFGFPLEFFHDIEQCRDAGYSGSTSTAARR